MSHTKENFHAIDVMKFICSIFVLSLHTITYCFANMAVDGAPPSGNGVFAFLMPLYYFIVRTAVPFFFITSSFFLFKKISNSPSNEFNIIKNYCKRLFILYFVWQLISLPYMIDKYFFNVTSITTTTILSFIFRIIFLNGFDGSWYLSASILGVIVVYFISKKFNNKTILIIASIIYLIPIFTSTYRGVFQNETIIKIFNTIGLVKDLYLSTLSSIIFIVIGKICAENTIKLTKRNNIIFLLIVCIMAYLELFITNYFNLNFTTDSFFMLPFLSFLLFTLIKNVKLKPKKYYLFLRRSSTFIYLIQFGILYCLFRFVNTFNWTVFTSNIPTFIAIFIGIIFIAMLICYLLEKIQNKKGFLFVKYLY